MTPDEVRGVYRRFFDDRGENVLIRRYYGIGNNRSKFEVEVKARVFDYAPQELIGTIIQGDVKALVLVEDLENKQFPVPILKNDKVIIQGKELNIEAVDRNTRKVMGELMAYELQVRG